MSLGSILGGIAKIGAGTILGGPAGGLAAAGTLLVKQQPQAPKPAYPVTISNPINGQPILQLGGPTFPPTGLPISNYPVPSSPSVPTTSSSSPQACPAVWNGTRWVRMHMNKQTYVTRGGGTSRWPVGLQVHAKGTVCVPNRRMNPGNGQAAKRAVRRLVAFYRMSNQVAKQLRKAASRAHITGRGRRKALPPGRGHVEVVNVE